VNVLIEAAKQFSIDVPEGFASYFSDLPKKLNVADKFILDMADAGSNALARNLIVATPFPTRVKKSTYLQRIKCVDIFEEGGPTC
jgi:hypothetical protein